MEADLEGLRASYDVVRVENNGGDLETHWRATVQYSPSQFTTHYGRTPSEAVRNLVEHLGV